MHKLHVFVILVGAFIVANTACRKENVINPDGSVKAYRDSTGNDTVKLPCDSFPHDSFPHDSFPHDSFPHDTFPWPPRDSFPHDTFPWPPKDSFPHDTFPWPDSLRRRHK